MKFLPLLGLVTVLMYGAGQALADGGNLLPSPQPKLGQKPATVWVFSNWILTDNPGDKGKVSGKVAADTDGHDMLNVASTESLTNLQMWWQAQGIACAGGSTYKLNVSVKGTTRSGTSRPSIGVYFMDAAGKWLGFQTITGSPGSIPSDWQSIEGKIAAPENAVTMGVRIGVIYTDGDADISYKDPVLVLSPASN